MIEDILQALELESLENGYQANISLWEQYFKGDVVGFHKYKEYNGIESVDRTRATLGMAKSGCEEWADIMYNPETKITMNESYQERLEEILSYNNFAQEVNFGIERGFALGTMGILTTNIRNIPKITIVTADMMIPITKGGKFGWAVISEYATNIYYVSIHYHELDGVHTVENAIITVENDKVNVMTEAEMKEVYNISPRVDYPTPMLQIVKPAIANNIDPLTPYGISVYANALSELQGIDLAYSGMMIDINTGHRITFTTVDNLDNVNGRPKFVPREGYYVMEGQSTFDDGTSIKFQEPKLQEKAYIDYLQANLNLYGKKIGFGENAFSFKEGNVYVNTSQVISTNSKLFKRRSKYLVILEEALERLAKAIYYLDTGREYIDDVSVDFDDSILHDKEQEEKELNFQFMNGMISEVYYWQVKNDLTEDQAIEFVKKQQELKGLVEMPEEEGGVE